MNDLPARLMDDRSDRAALRRTHVECTAIEMIRIGLYQARVRGQNLSRRRNFADETKH